MATIQVTRDDINRGERRNCRRCPLARAIRRLLKAGYSIAVAPTHVTIYRGRRWLRRIPVFSVALPIIAQVCIGDFDCSTNRREVEPITFELPIDAYCMPHGVAI